MTTTTHTPKRVTLPAAALPAAALLAAGLLLAGCGSSSDDSAAPGPSTGTASGGGASATPTDPAERALAYSQCMRDNGVANFPDPQQDGRMVIGPGMGVDPRSAAFKKAEEACKALSPQGSKAAGGKPLDPRKVADWAACVRAHGEPDFPDPQIQGSAMSVEMSGIDPNSTKFQKAMDACKDKRPQGGMIVKGGGGK